MAVLGAMEAVGLDLGLEMGNSCCSSVSFWGSSLEALVSSVGELAGIEGIGEELGELVDELAVIMARGGEFWYSSIVDSVEGEVIISSCISIGCDVSPTVSFGASSTCCDGGGTCCSCSCCSPSSGQSAMRFCSDVALEGDEVLMLLEEL